MMPSPAALRARAETLWTIALAGDDEGMEVMRQAGPEWVGVFRNIFVTGYLAGAIEQQKRETA